MGCQNKTDKALYGSNPYNVGCGGGSNTENDRIYFCTLARHAGAIEKKGGVFKVMENVFHCNY